MRWFERIVSMDGRLEGRERSDRRVMFTSALGLLMLSALGAVTMPSEEWSGVMVVCHGLLWLAASAIIVQCICLIYITKATVKVYIAILTVSICSSQLHGQANSMPPIWSLFVLTLDLSLVMRLGRSFATYLMGAVILWVTLLNLDLEFRFGLLDMPGTSSKSFRVNKMRRRYESCTDPPCALGVEWMAVDIAAVCLILLIDFIATRGFAEEAEKEHAAMAHTIETVETAAQLLAGYDVDTVSELLDAAEGRLAPAMHAALRGLEHNLRSYRPYLPAALFERVAGEAGDEESRPAVPVAAPGIESAEATVVFTDIRASTSVWEAAPEAMQKAIRIHNAVMRKAVSMFGGYEVKTIGDAFMVAFEGPCAGVDFGLAVQEALLAAEWPAALLEVPICRRTGKWGGLTVRVGVNHGPVMAELNTLTGRVDYFGHTVNVASRLESMCPSGAVAVPSAVWSQVCGACAPAVAGAQVMTDLKGVNEVVSVRHVWPAGLADRQRNGLSITSPIPDNDDGLASMHSGSVTSLMTHSPRHSRDLSEKRATVGVVSFAAVEDSASANTINHCLEAVVPLLQKSRGTLVSLLGEHVFTGWNLSQAVPVHAENAVHFVRRALRVPLAEHMTAGLATGTVYHGDVGTRSQRFMTVAGPAVSTSLLVWRTAREAGHRFLYTPGAGAVPDGALQAALQASTLALRKSHASLGALYELQQATGVVEHASLYLS